MWRLCSSPLPPSPLSLLLCRTPYLCLCGDDGATGSQPSISLQPKDEMTHLVRLALALAAALPLASAQLITCYAYDGSVHTNQTRCPGSNACCNPDATCLGNRLCHNVGYGPETLIRGPCAVEEYDSGTCAPICLYGKLRVPVSAACFFSFGVVSCALHLLFSFLLMRRVHG